MSFGSLRIVVVAAATALIANPVLAEEQIDYLQQIKPIFAKRCYSCHGALKQEAGLRLDTIALAIRGSESGPILSPGNPQASILIQRVTASDESERMPPIGEPLQPDQIAALRLWITQKPKVLSGEQPEADPRAHWAYRPIVRPKVPAVLNANWSRNPIDAFVAQQHSEFGLTAQAEASPEVLMRRLSIDLIGLPPTEADLALLRTASTDRWYGPFAERLLNDSRYGERWARHWMDVWRYSDWWGLGDQLRNSQQHIWHWRDWLVDSLNANLPYDEMVRLMLAADELHPGDQSKLRATGFLARNYFIFNRNQWMDETVEHVGKAFLGVTMNCAKCHDHKFDPISQVDYYRMRAIFEPYQVRLDLVPGEPDLARDGIPRVYDGLPNVPTYLFQRGQENSPDKTRVIVPGVPALLAPQGLAIHPVSLPKEAWQPERQPWVIETYLSAAKKAVVAAKASQESAKKLLAAKKNELARAVDSEPRQQNNTEKGLRSQVGDAEADLTVAELAVEAAGADLTSVAARAVAMRASWAKADGKHGDLKLAEIDRSSAAEAVKVERRAVVAKARYAVADVELKLSRASADKKEALGKAASSARESLKTAEQTAASTVTSADRFTHLIGAKWTPTRFISSTSDDPQIEFQAQSTGRRSALAAWITDRLNPLTARVAVNQIWMRHMGVPLVQTVFDFGRKGTGPTHPELLDWLAAEFISSGWDMKHLHRLIVNSSTYRMSSSSAGSNANLAKDPDNVRLWRRSPIRLEAEVVRDSVLFHAGTLDLTLAGPPVLPVAQADSLRRSLYFYHSNNDRNLFLSTFDVAGVKDCYRRDQSIVPQQALALADSRLVHDAAAQIAKRLSQPMAVGMPPLDDKEFVQKAFYELLGIRANEDESRASLETMAQLRIQPDVKRDSETDCARDYLIWALINHNDFVTLR